MKLSTGFLAAAASLPFAFAADHHRVARQVNLAASSAPTSTPAASSTTPAPSGATTPAATGGAGADTLPSGWLSTRSGAVPLASINANAPSAPAPSMPAATGTGNKPANIPNAPGLPNAAALNPANYPPLDKQPPLDSDLVKQWIAEVKASGVNIPGFSPNNLGGCPNNTAAAGDPSRCWWTCGGCTRDTDVTTCPDKLHWGLTYDDGPASYTPDLLNYLDQVNIKATFYVVGSRAISYPALLQEEYLKGHEIAVHTWAHPQLTTLSTEEIIAELGWTKKIIQDVLGVTPLYMRPPYGDIDDRVRAICKAMNLTPVMWTRLSPMATFDTADFDVHGGTATVGQVLSNWKSILSNATTLNTGFIVLEHDLFQQTVEIATDYILPDALAFTPKLTIEPVGTCLGLSAGSSYLETNDNKTNPLPVSATGAPSGTASGAQATGNSSSSATRAFAVPAGSSGFGAVIFAAAVVFGSAVLFA